MGVTLIVIPDATTVARKDGAIRFEDAAMRVDQRDAAPVELKRRDKIRRAERASYMGGNPDDLIKRLPQAGALVRANAEFQLTNPVRPIIVTTTRRQESYREVCVRQECTRTELPIASKPQPLGGIRLDAQVTGAALRGITIDPANGNIILLAEHNFLTRGLNLRDLAMALWLEFGPNRPQG